jgi:molybdopterin-containing oxidoreductase family iron-sulfur binding subunit
MPSVDRREFLKLAGMSAGAAATACHSEPLNKIIPYVVQPEEITPGHPVVYASTCRECPAGCGLHVKTREGRPVKLEGNPEHPINRGALCARGQVGIGRSYHPDRFRSPLRRAEGGRLEPISWEEAARLLADRIRANPGGTQILGGDRGPTTNALIDRWVEAVGAGGRVVYEPFAPEALRAAVRQVFGVERAEPVFDLSQADLVLDFGADSLETWLSPTEHARQLAEARDLAGPAHGNARFVYVGPRLSMTAGNADEWIPAKPGTEGILALGIARAAADAGAPGGAELSGLLAKFEAGRVATLTGVDARTIGRLGRAVAQARSAVALPPGAALASRRATATAAAVLLLDHVAGAPGRTLHLPTNGGRRASYREALALVDSMKSGRVSVLLVHDADPVYSMPAASGFVEALAKVPLVVSFASSLDETSERAHLVLPDHTPLESWGDAEPRPGVRSLQQPSLRPLHDTRALPDTLLDVARALGEVVAARLPAGSFRQQLEEAYAGSDFRQILARGGVFDAAPAPAAPAALAPGATRIEVAEPLLEGDGEYTLVAYPSPLLYDGRGANLPWLQEIPDPVTKVARQAWAEVSPATARALGVEAPGEILAIETPAGRIELPVIPRGGIRDDVVAVPIGQGHSVGRYASRAGAPRGANVIRALPAATDEAGGRAWLSARARLSRTGGFERIAFVQSHDNKRGRLLGEAVSLVALAQGQGAHGAGHGEAGAHGGEHGEGNGEGHGGHLVAYDPVVDARDDSAYRWGMSIDLDRCTGCSACVAACYVENNIPVVGEEATLLSRQMSWIRIERWVGEGETDLQAGRPPWESNEKLGDADIRHSAMLCQQCGAAPCEPVCPVIATYHNPEGLNGMVYNRCIGTRYCSNNCPYKVRRFNWFDYGIENWPEPMRLMLNPDVTVRGQGVMEKCTFCVQRISAARQKAKDGGRAIRDGEVVTACQQACPTQAIHFGNLKDASSRVSKKFAEPVRSYHALHELNTRPAIAYLAKVRRGSVEG